MKVKLSQIVEARAALQRLASEKFPANIAYRIQRNMRYVGSEADVFYATRDDLIRSKYGDVVPDTEPKQYQVKKENVQVFIDEINALLSEEIEMDIRKLSLNEVHDITPIDLMALEWMFETGEEPAQNHAKARKRSGK